jgi:hypothetical protein
VQIKCIQQAQRREFQIMGIVLSPKFFTYIFFSLSDAIPLREHDRVLRIKIKLYVNNASLPANIFSDTEVKCLASTHLQEALNVFGGKYYTRSNLILTIM